MLMSAFAQRAIVEYITDESVTVRVEFSSLLAFTVRHFTIFILRILFVNSSFFVFFVFLLDLRCFFSSLSMSSQSADHVEVPALSVNTDVGVSSGAVAMPEGGLLGRWFSSPRLLISLSRTMVRDTEIALTSVGLTQCSRIVGTRSCMIV